MVHAVRVVIADDDKQQARQLVNMLAKLQPSWFVVATPSDLPSLQSAIENTVPHVLLVDIHMPGDDGQIPGENAADGNGGNSSSNGDGDGNGSASGNGSGNGKKGVLSLLGSLTYQPAIILVTGDPGLALEAFELSVIDYVVKPIKLTRLQQALERARDFIKTSFKAHTEETEPVKRQGLDWITATRGLDSVLVLPEDVVYLQAERKYTRLMLSEGEALVRVGISELENMLDERNFLRVHRSTIVNVRHIRLVRRDEMGRLRIHLNSRNEKLSVSKPFESRFKAL